MNRSTPGTGRHEDAAATTVAALFVEAGGVYCGLPDVDVWDEARDARLYAGPHPVVAHPPCARWSRLAGFTEARFGYKRGEDGGCFEAALRAIHTFGGVLEHPAYSQAWDRFGLPEPSVREGWTLAFDGGASCYIEQGRYGLPVKKATWLYAFGVELPNLRWGWTPDADGEQPNGEYGGMDAWRDKFKGRREQWTSSKDKPRGPNGERRRASHLGLTSTTPPEFRDALLDIARSARMGVARIMDCPGIEASSAAQVYDDLDDRQRADRIDDICDSLSEENVPPDALAPIRAYAVWLRDGVSAGGSDCDAVALLLEFEQLPVRRVTDQTVVMERSPLDGWRARCGQAVRRAE